MQNDKITYKVGDTLPDGWTLMGLSPRTGKAYSLEPKDIALPGPSLRLAGKGDSLSQLELTPKLKLKQSKFEYSTQEAIDHIKKIRTAFNDASIRLPVYSKNRSENEPMDIYNKVGLCANLDPSDLGLETDEDHGFYFVLQDEESDDWQRVYRLDGKDVKDFGLAINIWGNAEWFRDRESNRNECEQVRCVRNEPDIIPADPKTVEKLAAIESDIQNIPGGLFHMFSHGRNVRRLLEEKLKLECSMAFHCAGQDVSAEAVKQKVSANHRDPVPENPAIDRVAKQDQETILQEPVHKLPDLPDPF